MRIIISVDARWLVGFLRGAYKVRDDEAYEVLRFLQDKGYSVTLVPVSVVGSQVDTAYRYLLDNCGLTNVSVRRQNKVMSCDVKVSTVFTGEFASNCYGRYVYHFEGSIPTSSNSLGVCGWVCLLGEVYKYRNSAVMAIQKRSSVY